MTTENDILGFDPQSLAVFNPDDQPKSQGNPLIYKTRPANAVAENGHYYATIKVVYNPFNPKQSTLDQQSYAIHDNDGWLTVVSSLTNNDTSCPIFKAWKKCHYADKGSTLWKQAASKDDGGKALFDKRFARYCVIQVLEDKNQPELVGKFLFWKLPKSIYDLITTKMNPAKESGKPAIPVMDYLFGRAIELEVIPGPGNPGDDRYARETKYIGELTSDAVSCISPDGSPLLNDEEQSILDKYVFEMSKVWKEKDPAKRNEMKAAVDADENTLALRKFYNEKIFPEIKKWCPNLIESLGYKEWDDSTKARVQRWIDIVLAGNDPTVTDEAPAAVETVGESTKSETSTQDTQMFAGNDEDSDDLPF